MKRIVVIEDDKILLKALNIELLSSGFEVLSADNGKAGLELVKKEKPDLVLLDLILPEMHGFEVLKLLKEDEELRVIPVVILSDLGQVLDIEKGMSLGAKDYHVKAANDLSKLSKKINEILGE